MAAFRLLAVNDKVIAAPNECWCRADNRLTHDPAIKTPTSIIADTLTDANNKLKQGRYFFSNIVTGRRHKPGSLVRVQTNGDHNGDFPVGRPPVRLSHQNPAPSA